MKYILSIAVAVLFCLPAEASAKYNLSDETARVVVMNDAIMSSAQWGFNHEAEDVAVGVECRVAISHTERTCMSRVYQGKTVVCFGFYTVKAKKRGHKFILVKRTVSNSCVKD